MVEVERSKSSGVCLHARDLYLVKDSRKSWIKTALEYLKEETGFDCDQTKVRYESESETPASRHLFYRQFIGKTPLTDAWIRIDIDLERELIMGIHSRLWDNKFAKRADLSGRQLGLLSKRGLAEILTSKKTRSSKTKHLVLARYARKGRCYRPAWKVEVVQNCGRMCSYYVDRQTRRVMYKLPSVFKSRGLVFEPSPMVTLNNPRLRLDQAIPREAYLQTELRNLDGSGFLNGPYVTTRGTRNRVKRTNGDFRFNGSSQAFGEVMAYHHIDRMQNYIQSLRFRRANPGQVRVIVNGVPGDNSEYRPNRNEIRLAVGGAPDYQDADVILHEYAHAVHSAINRRFGHGLVSVHLAEGFADYFALSQSHDKKNRRFQRLFASWDASANPAALRTQAGVTYRRTLQNRTVLSDFLGERPPPRRDDRLVSFWASVLWEIRDKLGRVRGDALSLGHLYFINAPYSFRNAALAIIQYNRHAYDGFDEQKLLRIFRRRGISLS
jgi:hypothetical protein